jgi:histidine ammonia-lyase
VGSGDYRTAETRGQASIAVMSAGSVRPGAGGEHGAVLAIGARPVRIEEILALARGSLKADLDRDPAQRDKRARSRAAVERALETRDGEVYGVTTGVGASADVSIPAELRGGLPHNLMRFHGVGTGRMLDETETGATVAVRLVSLARGYSGVREQVLERLCSLLNERILPQIPEEGSVGASGDLTPLSYLAAALVGEREVMHRGRVAPAADALREAGLAPLRLGPKESLAIMNGTAVMTAIACAVWEGAARLARLAAAITSVVVDVTHGNRGHFDARIFELKPHPGQSRCADWIREGLELGAGAVPSPPARLQDRYSLRCAPHVIGVLVDALEETRRTLEIEINGVDDNPLVDPDTGEILHGGNFYGGHVCHVMDGLKAAAASVADLLDRQLALLCVPETNGGLPANLVAVDDVSHHGFKAMQISASALTAEALKLTVPASAFSRSTESHNQDKVSMGTIAARDCRRVLELAETVASIVLLAACQALDLRGGGSQLRRALALREAVRKGVPMVGEDRRQDRDIERVLAMLREGALPIGSF